MNLKLESVSWLELQAEKWKAERRVKLQAGQERRLTGTAGDLTPDMFGQGETPLFRIQTSR